MARRMNLVSVPGSTTSSVDAAPRASTQHTMDDCNDKPAEVKSKPLFRQMNRTLLMMPDDILTIVLSKLSYDNISELRVVCHRFNRICQRLLNQGLQKLERYHGDCLKKLKAQLPRRESERRQHPLARHCDILSAVETRLSLLAMTYSKYIDLKVCCFIPGKVIDEAMEVLRFVMQSKEAPRTHDLLQELRDISSMAMEHFDEKIAPSLKKKLGENHALNVNTVGAALTLKELSKGGSVVPSTSGRPYGQVQNPLRTGIGEILKEVKVIKAQVAELRKVRYDQDKKITHQQQVVIELTSKITSQNERITEQERKIAVLEQQLAGNAPGPSGEFYTLEEVGGELEGSEEKNLEGGEVKVDDSADTSGKSIEGKNDLSSEKSGGQAENDAQSTADTESEMDMASRGRGKKRRSVNETENLEDSIAAGTKKRRQKVK